MHVKNFLTILLFMFPILIYGNGEVCQNNNIDSLKYEVQKLTPELFEQDKLEDKDYVKSRLDTLTKIETLMREEQYTKCITPEFIKLVDNQNRIAVSELKQIMKHYLWITIPEFGFKASEDAWIIVQHAMHDPGFQHKVLFLMGYFLPKQEVHPLHYANLYDRITAHYHKFGMKLKYGTQATYNDEKKEFQLLPYEGNLDELKKRRMEIGLSEN